jgi:C4-dicarboxylate-specific signal transduction histidine kinase
LPGRLADADPFNGQVFVSQWRLAASKNPAAIREWKDIALRCFENSHRPPILKSARAIASLWTALSFSASAYAVVPQTHNVLVLYSDNRLLPANIEADRSLRAAIANSRGVHIEVFDEDLDEAHFPAVSAEYARTVSIYLHDKYAAQPPEIIVAGGDEALDFILRNRNQLFPGTPVVHMGVDRSFIELKPRLPNDVIGDSVELDVPPTIELALRWHPLARRLVIVTGASAADLRRETRLRRDCAQFEGRVSLEFLTGLPTATLLDRLRGLGPDTVVFTPGYSEDGAGRIMTPFESVKLMAAAASAPIYVPYSTYIGTGVVGGRMATYDAIGREAGGLVTALLAGAAPETVKVPKFTPTDLHIDWRQVQRWGIDEKKIPREAIAHFRAPSLWEAYRKETIATIAALLLLGSLSIRLLVERRSLTRTSAALRASEERMGIVARSAKLAMWIWNVTENRISVEPSQTPFRSAELSSAKFPDALSEVHPADGEDVNRAVQKALDGNAELDLEYRTISQDGEVRWIAIHGLADRGSHRQWVGIVLDITERKQAQLQAAQDRSALQHLARVSMLGQMSASIAHQLNQPLTAILANAEAAQQMLRHDPVDLDEVKLICDDIVSQDQRAATVIRRLGALFKRGEMQIQKVDLNTLLIESLDLLRTNLTTDRITAATQLAEGLPTFDGDKVQLQQVLLNLVMNAADAMRDTPVVMRRLTISTEAADGEVRLRVADRGPGIAPKDMKIIFEPFWSGKSAGMGIGLSICQSIVAAHHGTLTVANNPDGGATFCLALPTIQVA